MKVITCGYCLLSYSILILYYFFSLDEELIKWGWPEDVWFHVDKLSSAHVYLRLNKVTINCTGLGFLE